MWAPDLDTNRLGAWAAAPGLGLIFYDTYRGGFHLYPRVDGPGAVTGLRAAVLVNTVTLSWEGAPGAATYVVEAASEVGATYG